MTSLWLAWHEARSRLVGFAVTAGIVATAVAVSAGLELGARAREAAVSTQMDRVAPGIRIVPKGVTSTDLRRLDFGERLLPRGAMATTARSLAGRSRHLEGRLVTHQRISGFDVPIIGVGEDDSAHAFLGLNEPRGHVVVVGHALGERLSEEASLSLWGAQWSIGQTLPQRGTQDDRSLFVALASLQAALGHEGRVNELRVFPHSVGSIAEIASTIRGKWAGVTVFESADRGGDAEAETEATLAQSRRLLHVMSSAAVFIALFVSALLEVRDRHKEVAMLVAMGASRGTLAGALVGRFTAAAGLGAVAGFVFSAVVVSVKEPETVFSMLWPWDALATVLLLAVAASAAATLPAATFAVMREHAVELQQ